MWKEVRKNQNRSRNMKGIEQQPKEPAFYFERQSRAFGDLSKKVTQLNQRFRKTGLSWKGTRL